MKLVVLKPFLIARTNGGDISLIERLRLFKSWGAEVQIHIARPEAERESTQKLLKCLTTPLSKNAYELDNLHCQLEFGERFSADDLTSQQTMEGHFRVILERENPDLVWSHYTDFFSTTAALSWNAHKTWVDLTDNEFPRMEKLLAFPSISNSYQKIRHFMVASPFMERQCRSAFPNAETILTPNLIESLNEEPVNRSPEGWIFVNPIPVKGVEFVLDLAQRMPTEQFYFVGNWISERPMSMPPNVKFIPRQKSLRSIFEKAKGLLMPSVWQEAFGRVPLEAMAAGVPVIASNRGALPETVGEGGLCLPLEAEPWVEAMSQKSNHLWVEAVAKGYKRAKAYQEETARHYAELKHRLQKFF